MKTTTRTTEYNDYLNSNEWSQKRQEAYAIHGKACQRCKSTNRLHVHHKTYARFKYEIVKTDLAVLCNDCHKYFHQLVSHTSIRDTNAFIKGEVIVKRERKPRIKHRKKFRVPKKNKKEKLLEKQKAFYAKIHKSDEDELLLTKIIKDANNLI